MENLSTHHKLGFLQGGGELGSITRAINWDKTSIGSSYTWPQSLRTTLGILLHSAFPMFLFWGPEHICFYNDAYRPSLGDDGKHPCVGKAGKEVWPEIWDFIGPLIEQVLTTGEPVWFEDQYLPIFCNGSLEDVYWTFSYSPAYGDSGEIAGVFVTCTETTKAVAERKELKTSQHHFRELIAAAEFSITLLVGRELRIEIANERNIRDWGKGPDVIGKTVAEALPELKGQPFLKLLDDVFNTGVAYHGYSEPATFMVDGKPTVKYYDYAYKPMRNAAGDIWAILVTGAEVTEAVLQQKALRASEARFRNLVMQAPFGVAIYRGENLVAETVNEESLKLMGKRREEMEGLPLFEAMPQLRERMEPVIKTIMAKGTTVQRTEIPTRIVRDGVEELAYFNATWTPFRDSEGHVAGVMAVGYDVTEQVLARQSIRQSEGRFRAAIDAVQGILWTNDAAGRMLGEQPGWSLLTGQNREEYQNYGWADAVHPEDAQPTIDAWEKAVRSRKTFIHSHRVRRADGSWRHYAIRAIPMLDEQGEIAEWVGVHTDITEQQDAVRALEASETRFRTVFEQTPSAIGLLTGYDMIVEIANEMLLQFWGKGASVIGLPLLEALPEIEGQGIIELLRGVYENNAPFYANAFMAKLERGGVLEECYFDLAYTPALDERGKPSGVIVLAIEVTSQVAARKATEESEQRLRSVIESAPFPIGIYVGRELRIQFANRSIIEIFAKGPDVVGKLYTEVLPELEGTGIFEQLRSVIETGEPIHMRSQRVDLMVNGVMQENYFNYSFTPLYNTSGEIYAVMNTAADVSDVIRSKQKIEEAEASLRGAVELAELGTWEVDLRTGSFTYSQRFADWIGKPSDAPSVENALSFTTPEYQKILADYLASVLAPGSDGLYDIEHPVVHQTSGEIRIIHAQGRIVNDETGTPVRLRGTAQDITPQRSQQEELERQVAERTFELAEANAQLTRSNEELAQYAYVASHDLQEPLRKIRVFSGMLEKQPDLSSISRELVGKVDAASQRMAMLIKDLLEFSRLLNSETLVRPVNLTEVCKAVASDFELSIREKGATLTIGTMPCIEAVGLQMNQLFYNLLSNALKFSKADVPPRIEISSRPMMPDEVSRHIASANPSWLYYDITIKDNGIGFDTKYAEQIFEVFKRLHGRDIYPGSGIGLALCRRIAVNAHGYLYAESSPGAGATFHIILPDRKD